MDVSERYDHLCWLFSYLFELTSFRHPSLATATKIKQRLVEEGYDSYEACQLSSGWWQRLKDKHGIHLKHLYGEAGSVDRSTAEESMEEFRKQVESLSIPGDRIINMDESGYLIISGFRSSSC